MAYEMFHLSPQLIYVDLEESQLIAEYFLFLFR